MPICESCGREENDTVTVQRMYLVAGEDLDSVPRPIEPGDAPTAGDIEQWCASCCATFPHVVVSPE